MARSPRIVIPKIPVNVTQRGNRQLDIFHDDEDKLFYMKRFMYYKRKYKVKLYAWCLMSNHIHFVLEPQRKTSLYKLFLCLNTSYVTYYNKKYGISGKLFGNRFFSCLLDDEHFYNTLRYVELNPIRANICTGVEDYYWTSAHEHLGKRSRFYLSRLPEETQAMITDWKGYLLEGLIEAKEDIRRFIKNIRSATKKGRPAGGVSFIQKVQKLTGLNLGISMPGAP